jgi:hypothetical protein
MQNLNIITIFLGIILLAGSSGCRESEYIIPNEFSVISEIGG